MAVLDGVFKDKEVPLRAAFNVASYH